MFVCRSSGCLTSIFSGYMISQFALRGKLRFSLLKNLDFLLDASTLSNRTVS